MKFYFAIFLISSSVSFSMQQDNFCQNYQPSTMGANPYVIQQSISTIGMNYRCECAPIIAKIIQYLPPAIAMNETLAFSHIVLPDNRFNPTQINELKKAYIQWIQCIYCKFPDDRKYLFESNPQTKQPNAYLNQQTKLLFFKPTNNTDYWRGDTVTSDGFGRRPIIDHYLRRDLREIIKKPDLIKN
jgi:hypothetical protein